MCGIWAIFGYDHQASSELHHALLIAHRGPDFFRIESLPNFKHSYLAFHRLSIMDNLTGQQPMRLYSLPHIHLTYNGEIYNFKELFQKYGFEQTTSMDGEIIIHLYNKFGMEKTLQLLDGVFAVSIFDSENGTFHIGRDTFGVRPLFTLRPDSGELGVSSEAKGLIGLNKSNGKARPIKQLKPGTYATFNICKETGLSKLLEEKSFTDVDVPQAFDIPITLTDDVKENIRNLLTDAVRKRLMAERRIGCLLSGGLDSSLVAALVVKLSREMGIKYPIQTFSIGFPGSPDVMKARKVAEMLQTEHHEVLITPQEALDALPDVNYALESYDITTNRASTPMFLLAKYIRKNTNTVVIFSGEGSDELTQGYIYFHKAPTPEAAHEDSKRLLRELYIFDNLRADRTISAHGLELRVPFLDKAFTSYYLSIDKQLVQPKDGVEKFLLRSAFDGHLKGLLPDEILWRPKEAFSDGISQKTDSWFSHIQRHAATLFTKQQLEEAAEKFPINPPFSFESLYYRTMFESKYPGQCHILPYFWMPRWQEGDVKDPSARVLTNYKQ
ncbi:asparagine synthetase [glutamine-hydrolyzing]-like [Clytia hemisphaerica]|uniref:Asparagine synthetase [glutamine-hydrolyzing] n=1 Tax=Clytia hemisphaerica TaxID=252671 RepID=A0A7M5VGI8_9CNID